MLEIIFKDYELALTFDHPNDFGTALRKAEHRIEKLAALGLLTEAQRIAALRKLYSIKW